MTTALTVPEQSELVLLESVIVQGLRTFIEVGNALLTIREKRLYRESHDTFEDYCRVRWNMTRRHANRLIQSAEVVENLLPLREDDVHHGGQNKLPLGEEYGTNWSQISNESENSNPIPLPTNEAQTRQLAALEPAEQREAWTEAVATSRNGKPTSDEVEETVKRRKTGNLSEAERQRQASAERLARQQANGTPAKPEPEPEPEPDEAPEVDSLGVPIQEHAKLAFEARPLFQQLLLKLKECRKLYAQLGEHPGGAYLLRPGISINSRESWKHKGIETAILNVTDCQPSITVCPRAYHLEAFPDCQDKTPHGDGCTLCHGLNWSRPLGKSEVAVEVIDKIKEIFEVE